MIFNTPESFKGKTDKELKYGNLLLPVEKGE